MVLWLTAVVVVFVVARNSAERAHQSMSSPVYPRLPGPQPWNLAGTRTGARSASLATAPGDRAFAREVDQPLRATQRDPAAGDSVPINSAGVQELSRLPGVGRRAAERIVQDRDRSGAFGSLEDLQRVEGFNRERIRRLSERATL
jgi:competence protein ComEA